MSDIDYEDPDALATDALMQTSSRESAKYLLENMHGLYSGDAEVVVESVASRMTMSAPAEIRASFATVVSWHRWHEMLVASRLRGDHASEMDAMKSIDAILRNAH